MTFHQIETAVGLSGFRPYYPWASQHNHGGFRPPHQGLGTVEACAPMLLIGPSDAGIVEPLVAAADWIQLVRDHGLRDTYPRDPDGDEIETWACNPAALASLDRIVAWAEEKEARRAGRFPAPDEVNCWGRRG